MNLLFGDPNFGRKAEVFVVRLEEVDHVQEVLLVREVRQFEAEVQLGFYGPEFFVDLEFRQLPVVRTVTGVLQILEFGHEHRPV